MLSHSQSNSPSKATKANPSKSSYTPIDTLKLQKENVPRVGDLHSQVVHDVAMLELESRKPELSHVNTIEKTGLEAESKPLSYKVLDAKDTLVNKTTPVVDQAKNVATNLVHGKLSTLPPDEIKDQRKYEAKVMAKNKIKNLQGYDTSSGTSDDDAPTKKTETAKKTLKNVKTKTKNKVKNLQGYDTSSGTSDDDAPSKKTETAKQTLKNVKTKTKNKVKNLQGYDTSSGTSDDDETDKTAYLKGTVKTLKNTTANAAEVAKEAAVKNVKAHGVATGVGLTAAGVTLAGLGAATYIASKKLNSDGEIEIDSHLPESQNVPKPTLVDKAKGLASQAAVGIQKGMAILNEKSHEANVKAGEMKDQAVHKATDLKQDAVHKATDLKHDATHKATDLKHDAAHKATDLKQGATHKATDLKQDAAHKATDLKAKATGTAENVKDKALGAKDAVTDKVSKKDTTQGTSNLQDGDLLVVETVEVFEVEKK